MVGMAWNTNENGKWNTRGKADGRSNYGGIFSHRTITNPTWPIDTMKGLTKLRPLGRLGGREKTRYGQLGMKSKHGDESDSEDSDFAREDLDYQSGLLRHISFYQIRLSFSSLFSVSF